MSHLLRLLAARIPLLATVIRASSGRAACPTPEGAVSAGAEDTIRSELARQRRRIEVVARFDRDARDGRAAPIERYLDEVPTQDHHSLREDLEEIAADYAGGTSYEKTAPWAAAPSDRLSPGSMLGPYRIEEWVAGGGMGDVYRARDTREIDRAVALKVLRPGPGITEDLVRRFVREIRVNGRLDHEGVVPTYDVGEDRGRHYLVLKFFAGGSLGDRVKKATLPDREAAGLLAQVASAVHHGHLRGIFHRDLKPSNILLDAEGRPHVGDYGLARLLDSDDDLTRHGALLGTVSYMAPEQAKSPGEVREPADVYGLGATLYCLLTGRPPFQSTDLRATLQQVLDEQPVPPRRLNPAVSLDTEAVCLKCLEKDPRRRFADAKELADELRRVERGEPTRTRPLSWAGRLVRWSRRRPAVAALSASLVSLAVVSFTAVTLLGVRAEQGRRRLERDDYYHLLALSAEALRAGRSDRAARLLADCPTALRGWEWRLLRRWVVVPPEKLDGPDDQPGALGFRPDSSAVICVGRRGYARIWEPGAGTVAPALPGLPPEVSVVDVCWLSPPGRPECIVAACDDGRLRRWDLGPGGWPPRPAEWAAPAVTCLAAHARTGRLLGGGGGRIVEWDLASGRPRVLATLAPGSRIWDVAISPDGSSYAATGGERKVWVGRFDGGTPRVACLLSDTGMALAYSPAGKVLAVGAADGSVLALDPSSAAGPLRIGGHNDSVGTVAFSPDGRRLASGGGDGRVKVWDVDEGREALSLELPSLVAAVAFSPDGRRLVAACDDGPAVAWNTDPPPGSRPSHEIPLRGPRTTVVTVAVSADGRRVASGDNDGAIFLWDVASGGSVKLSARLAGPLQKVNGVAFRGDGLRLATAGRDRVLRVWDVTTGAVVHRLPGHSGYIGGVAFAPDGRHLASADSKGEVRLWDAEEGRLIRMLGTQPGEAYALAYHPRRPLVATAGSDRAIWIWDTEAAGRGIPLLPEHSATIDDLDFSPDGRSLASAGADRIAIIWDIDRGAVRHRLLGHASRVWGVDFSPDGRLLATAGGDGLVILWDVETGRKLGQLKEEGATRVCAVAFSPDGRFLASGGGGAPWAVRLWGASNWADLPRH
jgi:WD40 repeat protein